MCGIMGLISTKPVLSKILAGLERLEYRGYDSAGIAVIENGEMKRCRSVGFLENLRKKVPAFTATVGIGHTRWATHGAPHEFNAHPHFSQHVAVVHNGIIENFSQLKTELLSKGVEFESETDTEVVAHLLDVALELFPEDIKEAFQWVLSRLKGSFSLVVLFKEYPNVLAVARQGSSPLVVGYGKEEMIVSSDALGLMGLADRVVYLEDQNWGLLTLQEVQLFDFQGKSVPLNIMSNPVISLSLERGGFQHYMLKEIHEQSSLVKKWLRHEEQDRLSLEDISLDRITFLGCGTAFYAGYVGKYYWEKILNIPISMELASEFHYRTPPLHPEGIIFAISQSGETADTLQAAEYARKKGQKIFAIVNVPQSSLARTADRVFYTHAGPEIGVASTKAFMAQVWVLLMLALSRNKAEKDRMTPALEELPLLMEQTFLLIPRIQKIAQGLVGKNSILFLGRGINYVLSLEGALKMKEISYIHAEGLPLGELKHGSLALIDEAMPTIVLAPYDSVFEKTLSNIHEISARSSSTLVITDDRGVHRMGGTGVQEILVMPSADPLLTPFISTLVLQLLSYYTAFYQGDSIDKPRHLAKSVTVE